MNETSEGCLDVLEDDSTPTQSLPGGYPASTALNALMLVLTTTIELLSCRLHRNKPAETDGQFDWIQVIQN